MKSAVVLLPGLNRDRDMIEAVTEISGKTPITLWESQTELPSLDLIIIPGGFSYGDYLRCGAIAARTPVMQAVVKKAKEGVLVIGVCNGFQILTETGLLPGTLMPNASLQFVCRAVNLDVVNTETVFTRHYKKNQNVQFPVAHHDGNFFADEETLHRLEQESRVVFRYTKETNPNGSINNIAGIINDKGNVLGLMPHPENFIEPEQGGCDGRTLFESIFNKMH